MITSRTMLQFPRSPLLRPWRSGSILPWDRDFPSGSRRLIPTINRNLPGRVHRRSRASWPSICRSTRNLSICIICSPHRPILSLKLRAKEIIFFPQSSDFLKQGAFLIRRIDLWVSSSGWLYIRNLNSTVVVIGAKGIFQLIFS